MTQTRTQSAIEVSTNVLIGLVTAFVVNLLVLPMFGVIINTNQSMHVAVLYTIISLVRGYCVRRAFAAGWWFK